jgi:hypothetical protein
MSTPTLPARVVGFDFDLQRCVVFDIEVFRGRWCVGFHGPGRGGTLETMIIDGDRRRLSATLERFGATGRILCGYNSERFDVPIVRAILAGADTYPLAQAIIHDDRSVSLPRGAPDFACDHIDLSARLRRGGGFPGLKTVAANLGRPMLRELPFPHGKTLTDEEWSEVKVYNAVDLGHTWCLLERLAPELQALTTLSVELGRDVRSVPTPQVVEAVFRDAYRREHGGSPPRPEPPTEVIYRPVAGVVRPRTPEAAAWYDRITQPLAMVGTGDRLKPEVPRAQFSIGGLTLSVGAGGLHSIERPMVHYATRRRRLVSVDVASYYPTLIAAKGIAPAAYGETGAATYRAVLERRLAVKEQAKVVEDPAERERFDVQATALKLVLNSTFGKFGDPHSSLYDPAAMLAVTLSGQLMLIDLIERLTAERVRVLSANTDGLFLHVPRGESRWRKVLQDWQHDTDMVLEVEALKRLAVVATNNFATIDAKGKVKRKGDKLKGTLSPFASPNALAVNDAVADALLRDVPPERTVRACTDPVRFCRITRFAGKVTAAVLVDDQAKTEEPLPRVTRWYKAKDSPQHIVHRFEDARHTTPPGAVGVAPALDLGDGALPADLDRSWYIAEARRVVQKVRGYRHLSPKRLEGHPLAIEALQTGLVPCPKWNGKAVLPGADAAAPTYLWDWSGIRTAGTYSGPAVGILVADVDVPELFRRWIDKGNAALLADRWNDLRGCLVSVHGETTAEEVRTGRGRGKLIFKLAGDLNHPLARLSIGRWHKTRGVEVFYGRGIPSVVGEHSSGEVYRIEGTLGEAPAWLIEGLTPARDGTGSRRAQARKGKPQGAPLLDSLPPDDDLDRLQEDLSRLAPELGSALWRRKDHDGRVILVGRCPYEHDSGRNGDADLSAGFHDGEPYVHCLHQSCTRIREINERLQGEAGTAEPLGESDPSADSEPSVSPTASEPGSSGSRRDAPASPNAFVLVTTRASAVRPEPVEFLDGGVIPRGKLITLAGLGGAGKGMFWANLVADLTRGRQTLGLSYKPPPAFDVLLIGCEDGYRDTVTPRLLAAGADLDRVHIVEGIRDEKGRIRPFSLAYLDEMAAYLAAHPAIALVIIDPITGYIGRAGVKDHHDADVRTLLEPLADLANQRETTIMATKHLNKDEAKTLASRVGGSIAYVNVPRACFAVADDPKTKGRRILAPFKWNLNAPIPPAIAWTMELVPPSEAATILAAPTCDHLNEPAKAKLAGQLNRLIWAGAVEVTADDLLRTAAKVERKQTRDEVDRATEWLRARLAHQPAGSILCAKEGDLFLGRRWPDSSLPTQERQRIVHGRTKWWREKILKERLGGETKRAGYNGPYLFRLPTHAWPPDADVAVRAQQIDAQEMASTASTDSTALEEGDI